MINQEKILDAIYEAMPDDPKGWGIDFYGSRENLPEAELYFTVDGQCWRITATPHPHATDWS